MRGLGAAIGQALVLVVLAGVLGLSVNAVRAKDHVRIARDYKPRNGNTTHPITQTAPTDPETIPAGTPVATDSTPAADEPCVYGPTVEIPFQSANLAWVCQAFDDMLAGVAAVVFVDARADGPYQDGHVPGAVQCDYWRIEAYRDATIAAVTGAEKVIVYCNGGNCEDSLEICRELVDRLQVVPWGNIYLFKGGWEEWQAKGLPEESGRAQP